MVENNMGEMMENNMGILFNDFPVPSYSQEGEDMILKRIFENKKDGFYVDVGAFHPIRFSNTLYFYRKGWRGINIEANPEIIELFNKFRPRDININVGVGKETKELTYFMFNEPALNTFDEELAKQRDGLNEYKIIKTMKINLKPLREILDRFLPRNQTIDFMNIDVEGLDFEVLQGNDWEKYSPNVILVEIIPAQSIEDILQNSIYIFLKEKGYKLFAKTFNTCLFKKEEKNYYIFKEKNYLTSTSPIVLFTFNRPRHLKQTLNALQKNELADKSPIFIFSDGPKEYEDLPKIAEIRKYIKTIRGFKKIEIIERDNNWGLANNIIDGVTKIVNDYGKVIVLEDDLVTSPYFLKFMNDALNFYEDKERVMHISAYIFPIRTEGLPDTFFLKPTTCWGWATWKRAWVYFERNPEKQVKLLNNQQIIDFNLDNSYNYWEHLLMNFNGQLYTWAVFWYLSVYLKNGLSLHPRESLTRNIGIDQGTHFKGETNILDVQLSSKNTWVFETKIEENLLARARLIQYYRRAFGRS